MYTWIKGSRKPPCMFIMKCFCMVTRNETYGSDVTLKKFMLIYVEVERRICVAYC